MPQCFLTCDIYASALTLKAVTDLKGRFISVNEEFTKVTSYTINDLDGKIISSIRHKSVSKSFYVDMMRTLKSGRVWKGKVQFVCKDGTSLWGDGVVYTIYDDDEEPVAYCAKHILCSPREIEEFKKVNHG